MTFCNNLEEDYKGGGAGGGESEKEEGEERNKERRFITKRMREGISASEMSLNVLKRAGGEMVTDEARTRYAATENAGNQPREAGFDLRCKGYRRM